MCFYKNKPFFYRAKILYINNDRNKNQTLKKIYIDNKLNRKIKINLKLHKKIKKFI